MNKPLNMIDPVSGGEPMGPSPKIGIMPDHQSRAKMALMNTPVGQFQMEASTISQGGARQHMEAPLVIVDDRMNPITGPIEVGGVLLDGTTSSTVINGTGQAPNPNPYPYPALPAGVGDVRVIDAAPPAMVVERVVEVERPMPEGPRAEFGHQFTRVKMLTTVVCYEDPVLAIYSPIDGDTNFEPPAKTEGVTIRFSPLGIGGAPAPGLEANVAYALHCPGIYYDCLAFKSRVAVFAIAGEAQQ